MYKIGNKILFQQSKFKYMKYTTLMVHWHPVPVVEQLATYINYLITRNGCNFIALLPFNIILPEFSIESWLN